MLVFRIYANGKATNTDKGARIVGSEVTVTELRPEERWPPRFCITAGHNDLGPGQRELVGKFSFASSHPARGHRHHVGGGHVVRIAVDEGVADHHRAAAVRAEDRHRVDDLTPVFGGVDIKAEPGCRFGAKAQVLRLWRFSATHSWAARAGVRSPAWSRSRTTWSASSPAAGRSSPCRRPGKAPLASRLAALPFFRLQTAWVEVATTTRSGCSSWIRSSEFSRHSSQYWPVSRPR